jgi:hypothetical protein
MHSGYLLRCCGWWEPCAGRSGCGRCG